MKLIKKTDGLFWNQLKSISFRMKIPSLLFHISKSLVHNFEFDFIVFVTVALGLIDEVEDVFVRGVVLMFQWDSKDYRND